MLEVLLLAEPEIALVDIDPLVEDVSSLVVAGVVVFVFCVEVEEMVLDTGFELESVVTGNIIVVESIITPLDSRETVSEPMV